MIARKFAVLLIGMFALPAASHACKCSQAAPGKCTGLPQDGAVFLGTVTGTEDTGFLAPAASAASDDASSPHAATRITHYHLRIDEHFAGPADAGIDIYSGGDDGDCGYRFATGTQYVVFAHVGNDGRLFATICSGTRPVEGAQALLPQLRAMRDGKRVASVFGVLRRANPALLAPPNDPDEPLSSVSLKLQSSDDRFQTNTDADGVFTYYDVHGGQYLFTAALLRSRMELEQRAFPRGSPFITIPDGACYEYDVDALPTGHLSGSVLGPDGKTIPVASLELYRVGAYSDSRPGLWGFQGATGVFDFDHVGPGDYILVFNRANRLDPDAPFPRTFYPGVSDLGHAKPIHLKDGEERLRLNLRVKNAYPTRLLRVRLKWVGPRPAGNVTVMARAKQGENPIAEKLADDLYEFTLLESATYTVSAWEDLDPPKAAPTTDAPSCVLPSRIATAAIDVPGNDASTREVLLVLPDAGCVRGLSTAGP